MIFKRNENEREQILELYDGQTAKLSDKKLISDVVPELKYSSHGKELFALSESFYCKWLKEGKDLKLVERAIELCRAAVAEGYPHAVVKMGYYYDKDYIALDRTEEFRCRVASDYYCKVVYHDETPRYVDAVTPEISWEDLQRVAAGMFMDMLAGAQKSLSGYASSKYSYEENFKRLSGRYSLPVNNNLSQRSGRDKASFAVTVLESCKLNKTRAPLFGVINLTADETRFVFVPKGAVMKICGDLNLWINGGNKITRVNNTSAFNSFLKELSGESVWIYFFNNNLGGHKYLTGAQRKTLCDLMMRDGFSRFIRLKESAKERGRSEYLFSDDDIRFFISGRLTSLKSALDNLIDRVVSDKEWDNL